MTRRLTAAGFAAALALGGVACDDDDADDVGDEIDEGVDELEDEVDGDGE